MYSNKSPLKNHTHGGGGTIGDPSATLKDLLAISENCDPNLSVHRKNSRKAGSSIDFEETPLGTGHGTVPELPKREVVTRRANCEGDGQLERHSTEVNRSVQSVPSPTRVSATPHQYINGHSHRQHFCRSPRCASNNPDYAVPVQPTPRKYLISKRHLLPGSICTRDPASVAELTGDSPLQTPYCGKPPKPSRKCESGLRQPSEATAGHFAEEFSATRIPKPLSAATRKQHTSCSPEESSIYDASADHLLSNLEPSDGSICVGGTRHVRFEEAEDSAGMSVNLSCIDRGAFPTSQTFAGSECSRKKLEVENSKVESQLSLEKINLPTSVPPLSRSCPFPTSFSNVHPSTDLKELTDRLAQKLAFEKEKETSQEVINNKVVEGDSIAGIDAHQIELEESFNIESEGEDRLSFVCVEGQVVDEDEEGDGHSEQVGASFCDSVQDLEETARQESRACLIACSIQKNESSQDQSCDPTHRSDCQRGVQTFVRGKGRQLWRSDCRDSREVVFLKQTSPRNREAGDWMVDSILEGAISKLNPSGHGRVRILVEAFESLVNQGETEMLEKRASRVWCLNRMEEGEVDEDGDEFEDGDQRVDCYEVSTEGLQLRASMRLSLGGGSRQPLCRREEASEIEISAIQKVEDWDPSHQSTSRSNLLGSFDDHNRSCDRFPSSPKIVDQDGSREALDCACSELVDPVNEDDSFSDYEGDGRFLTQFSCSHGDDGKQETDELDPQDKLKATRHKRFWKATSLKTGSDGRCPNDGGSAEKHRRLIRGTLLEPFHLLTEERGAMKEYQFARKLEQMFAEEDRLRNPIAQGLPWTTDEPEVVPKPPVKEQTRPVEFRHYSTSRAIERAEFDSYVAERIAYEDMRKEAEERLSQMAEQEEVKRLRREMIPRAQVMPFFNQPFMPSRSSKRLTVPKEPSFHNKDNKRPKCIVWNDHQRT